MPADQLVQVFSGVIVFYCPSSPDFDRGLTLTPGADGSQSVHISKMEFGIAIALGFVGSPHYAAMCGPQMLALPAMPGGSGRLMASRVTYQLGRVTTYCLLGELAAGVPSCCAHKRGSLPENLRQLEKRNPFTAGLPRMWYGIRCL